MKRCLFPGSRTHHPRARPWCDTCIANAEMIASVCEIDARNNAASATYRMRLHPGRPDATSSRTPPFPAACSACTDLLQNLHATALADSVGSSSAEIQHVGDDAPDRLDGLARINGCDRNRAGARRQLAKLSRPAVFRADSDISRFGRHSLGATELFTRI